MALPKEAREGFSKEDLNSFTKFAKARAKAIERKKIGDKYKGGKITHIRRAVGGDKEEGFKDLYKVNGKYTH